MIYRRETRYEIVVKTSIAEKDDSAISRRGLATYADGVASSAKEITCVVRDMFVFRAFACQLNSSERKDPFAVRAETVDRDFAVLNQQRVRGFVAGFCKRETRVPYWVVRSSGLATTVRVTAD